MSSLKVRSASDKKSPASTDTNRSTTTETVIEAPAFSYCHWVTLALAVAIIAVVVGAWYIRRETPSTTLQTKEHGGNLGKIIPNTVEEVSDDKSKSKSCKDNAKNKRDTGLVFYMNIIAVESVETGWSDNYQRCVVALGGKHRADMLITQFKRLSETKKLFIIEDDPRITVRPEETVQHNENVIRVCMTALGIWECFAGMYVWESRLTSRLSEIEKVVEKTRMDKAKLHFISSPGVKSDFLKENKFNVIEVNHKIEESDFQKIE